jgi:Tol biopolymer transport system component
VWWWKGPAPEVAPATEYTLRRITWDGALAGFPALSPDGRLLAYASDRAGNGDLDIWVQQVEGGSLIRVTDSPADELYPSFSPDGTRIVFFRWGEGVYVIPALGGDPYLVAKDAAKPVFGPDGETVAFFREGRLYQSPVSMGEPKRLMASLEELGPPLWTPDGSQIIAYGRRQGEPPDWWAVPASDDSPPRKLGAGEVFRRAGHYLPYPETWSWSGTDVLLGSDGELYRVPLDPRTWDLAGGPERLTFGSGVEALPSGSADGKIAFMDLRQRRDIWSLRLDSRTGAAVGEPERLTLTESSDTAGDISPASDRLVYISNRWGRRDIWTKDLATGRESNLSNDGAVQLFPVISPDGQQVAYLVEEESKRVIYVRPYAGGIGRGICADCGTPRSWTADGQWILFDRQDPSGIHVLNVDTSETAEILSGQGLNLDAGRVSFDGQWISFRAAAEGGEVSLYAAPFRGQERVPREEWITVTSHVTDLQPTWGARGDVIYFTSSRLGSHDIWMQRLNPSTKQPLGDAQVVRRFPSVRYSLQLMTSNDRRLAASRDMLVFPMSEVSGNVWLMEPKAPASEP